MDILDYDIYVSEKEYKEYRDGLKVYFHEPMEKSKKDMVGSIFDKLHAYDNTYMNGGIDVLQISLPPHKL